MLSLSSSGIEALSQPFSMEKQPTSPHNGSVHKRSLLRNQLMHLRKIMASETIHMIPINA